jgi:DNA-directed RNA polymerase sigma subunit (sigma70/sigma32)
VTLESIGRRMGVTRERVRQIEAAALKRLRTLLAARDVKPSDRL